MNSPVRNFLIKNLLLTLLFAVIGTILFLYFLKGFFHPLYPVLLIVALAVSTISFYFSSKPQLSGNKMLTAMMKSFAIRFFLYLGIAVIFLLLEKQTRQRIVFIITMFCIYLVYSFIEIRSLLKVIRSKK